ncbi:hypothetical protein AB0467_34680, partial [Streptomyces sp. NPDC052095]
MHQPKSPIAASQCEALPKASFAARHGPRFCRRFCKSHHIRWRQDGDPPTEDFIIECRSFGRPRVDFRALAPQLKLEFQYAVQARHDEQTVTAPARLIQAAIRRAQQEKVASLLDYSAERWQRIADPYQHRGASGGYGKRLVAFLLYARDTVETLRDGAGWEVEYARDVWRLDKLAGLNRGASQPRPRSELRFDRMAQPRSDLLEPTTRPGKGVTPSPGVADDGA